MMHAANDGRPLNLQQATQGATSQYCALIVLNCRVLCAVYSDLEICEDLVSDHTPECNDMAHPGRCKQLTTIAEAAKAALLQGELVDLFKI